MKRIAALLLALFLCCGAACADVSAYELAMELAQSIPYMENIRNAPLEDYADRAIWIDNRKDKSCALIVHEDAGAADEAAIASGTSYTMVRAVGKCTIHVSSELFADAMEEYEGVLALVLDTESQNREPDYILNVNTKKFHYPGCSSVKDMKETNKQPFAGNRDEVLNQGYVPCKRCDP